MVYNKSFKVETQDQSPYSYYKSFNNKPVDFRKMNDISDSDSESDYETETDEDVDDSSSEYSDSSSDGFPSPGSPRKREDYRKSDSKSYNELYTRVQDIQRRLSEMEIQNKRR
jgi:hypothetical protein